MSDHWTGESDEGLQLHIANQFLARVEVEMLRKGITRKVLAGMLGVREGRVAQIFGKPGNLTIMSMIRLSKVVGLKPAVILYGSEVPVLPDVFERSWEVLGCPVNLFEIGKVREGGNRRRRLSVKK